MVQGCQALRDATFSLPTRDLLSPKVTDPHHSPSSLHCMSPPPWAERPGGVRSAWHLPIPGRFRVVDFPPTSLCVCCVCVCGGELMCVLRGSKLPFWGCPPHPSHGSGNTDGAGWYPIPYRAPSPGGSFGLGLKIKIRFKSALAGLRL